MGAQHKAAAGTGPTRLHAWVPGNTGCLDQAIRMPALVPCTQPAWQEENSSKLARCPRLLATATPELIPLGFAWYTNFCILYPRRPEIFIFFLIST